MLCLLSLPLQGPVFSFADDTAIVYVSETFSSTVRKCEEDLQKLNKWLQFQKICPKLGKTLAIFIQYKKTKENTPLISWHLPTCKRTPCNCHKIKVTPETKYLGIILNSNLNWEGHSLYQQTKLRRLNYLTYHIKNIIPPKYSIKNL